MKTKKEINAQIKLLKLQRVGIPERSGFGDDNHGNIDVQIRTLGMALVFPEHQIRDMADEQDILEAKQQALDWTLGRLSDDLVEPDDLWVKKALDAGAKP